MIPKHSSERLDGTTMEGAVAFLGLNGSEIPSRRELGICEARTEYSSAPEPAEDNVLCCTTAVFDRDAGTNPLEVTTQPAREHGANSTSRSSQT